MEETLTRVFIGITFPDEVIKEIARAQEMMSKEKFTGKLTELANLHLTLKFLGEIDEEKVKQVIQKLKEIKFNEFEASLGIMGVFASNKNPRIVWVKINSKALWELQEKVDSAMVDIGFEKEERFMGHATLSRIKYVKDKQKFIENMINIKIKPLKFKVSEFKLMKSELSQTGPAYSVIEKFTLANQ